jgi:hypothetical protein
MLATYLDPTWCNKNLWCGWKSNYFGRGSWPCF